MSEFAVDVRDVLGAGLNASVGKGIVAAKKARKEAQGNWCPGPRSGISGWLWRQPCDTGNVSEHDCEVAVDISVPRSPLIYVVVMRLAVWLV